MTSETEIIREALQRYTQDQLIAEEARIHAAKLKVTRRQDLKRYNTRLALINAERDRRAAVATQ